MDHDSGLRRIVYYVIYLWHTGPNIAEYCSRRYLGFSRKLNFADFNIECYIKSGLSISHKFEHHVHWGRNTYRWTTAGPCRSHGIDVLIRVHMMNRYTPVPEKSKNEKINLTNTRSLYTVIASWQNVKQTSYLEQISS